MVNQIHIFLRIPNFWAWADELGRTFFGQLGYFRLNYQLLVPNTKYLFGIGISIWAAKNSRSSHHASIVRFFNYEKEIEFKALEIYLCQSIATFKVIFFVFDILL